MAPSDAASHQLLKEQVEDGGSLRFHLAPPLLSKKDAERVRKWVEHQTTPQPLAARPWRPLQPTAAVVASTARPEWPQVDRRPLCSYDALLAGAP